MRVFFSIVACILFGLPGLSQTFTGTGGSIPGTSTTQTCFSQTVSGVGIINGTYGLASVCINITHPNDDELEIVLTAPDGTVVPLSIQNGGAGNNYSTTCFTATATIPIKFGVAPFNGNFIPEGHLGAVNNGQSGNGAWQLCIQDRRTGANAGTLNSWSLHFNNTPAPIPPALPSCANTLPSNSSCATATLVCDFNGQCGSTSGTTVQDWPGSGLDGCFGLQNNSFIRFIAAASTASFSVWVPTTTQASYNQGGIQMLFFSGTCNSGPVTTYGCYPHILPYSGTGQPLITVVTASGLTPGNTYYLMIDGFNNDNCSFTIAANTGVNVLNISPAAPVICAGSTVSLTASGGNGIYSWSPPTNLNTTTGATVIASPPATTTYTVTSTTASGCPLTKDVTVTVNPIPAAPTATITQPICTYPFGIFVFNTPIGAQYEYSINGTVFQSATVFNNIAPGNYTGVVKDLTTGCVSAAFPFTINAVPAPPAPPTVTFVQPNCGSTGSITVTSPLGADFEYSVNNGPFQSSPVFTGLSGIPSPTEVRVRSVSGSCISNPTLVPLVASPVPQPFLVSSNNCQTPPNSPGAGQISFLSPVGANYEYSVNGGTTYQTNPVFNNLPHGTYIITYRVISTGCVAATQTVTLTGITGPSAYTLTQPLTCNAGGTVTVTAPLGSQYSYQLLAPGGNPGMPWQSSPVFNNVPAGTYGLVVGMGQCLLLDQTPIVITSPGNQPGPLNVVTIHPTCTTPTGTIIITPPAGNNLEYSINGTIYQASTTFNNVPPGNYQITVRNTVTGCVSGITTTTVVSPPSSPGMPVGSVTTQPDCDNSGGTITITSPLGNGYEYSVNGGTTFQSAPVFTILAPNTYNVVVKDINSGCVSAALQLTVVPGPLRPEQPTMSTVQPDCNGTVGSITVTAPLGPGLQYNVNSGPYQSSTLFSNLPQGIYLVTAKDATGCVSHISTAIILEAATSPAKPVLTATQPSCPARVGEIRVDAPVGTSLEYSINGGAYQSSNVFSNLPGGTYSIKARYTGTTCISSFSSVQIIGFNPDQCLVPADGDIYFPSAFTPNGDGINDGFGPGPRTNLGNITGYSLTVFNRYGEKVFESNDPLAHWSGIYKGKILANYSYTWVARYRYGTRPVQVKKGSVTVVR
jgi:gliding motility-associated-like protein